MHLKRYARKSVLWGTVLAAGLCVTATFGQDPKQPPAPLQPLVQVDAKTGALIVPLGGVVSFEPDTGKDIVTDIVVSREDVLQVRVDPNNPKRLLLTGRVSGSSQLTLVFKERAPLVLDVVVQPDLTHLRNVIRRTVPTAAVEVSAGIGNVIILSGYVTSPQDSDIVLRLATNAAGGNTNNVINAIQIGGGQHVQIDVVVASVDRTLLRQRGFDFAVGGTTVNFQSIVSGLIGAQQQGGTGGLPGLQGLTPAANFQFGILPTPFIAGLQALRNEGVAKFIAEPRVVTQSGRPARFLAGGRQAVVSAQVGIVGAGAELVDFGTELEVLPIVYGNGMIWLEINPRVTAVNFGLGIIVNGQATPGFTEQSVRTAVMLESGQTYAIGGLIQNSVRSSASKVPVLGDLPFIGAGFSRVEHENRESELVILVTPRLVGPMNCDQVPKRLPGRETRDPDDYELFLENIHEAPRGQRKVWNGRCYNAPYKCDPTIAIFPCVGNVCTGPGLYGTSCGPMTGCATPGVTVPATLPAIPAVPAIHGGSTTNLPALPSVSRGGADPVPSSLPGTAPPVIVVPEVPRN